MAPKVIYQFISETLPFNRACQESLMEFVESLEVEYFPKGAIIFRQNGPVVEHLYIIQRGAVKVFLGVDQDHVTLRDLGGEGSIFGAEWILGSSSPDVNVEAVEDTFCLVASKRVFLDFLARNPGLEKHFRFGFSEDKISEIYASLRAGRIPVMDAGRFDYFSTLVSQIVRNPAVTVERTLSVIEAAKLMTQQGLGSILVRDSSSNIIGIVTKKDLRAKVVAQHLDYQTPVDLIMSSPVKTIPAQAICFEAMIKMIREQITHLAVKHGSEIIGIVSAHDIMVNQVAAPVVLLREMANQTDTNNLNLFHQRLPSIVRRLIEQGARSSHLLTLVALMNDRFVTKVMALTEKRIGKAPFKFTRLLFGDSGRKETSLFPCYDNGLVFEDLTDETMTSVVFDYMEKFACSVADVLKSCCGQVLKTTICASNPRWRQPFSVWKKYFTEAIRHPIPPDLLINKRILDFRSLFGHDIWVQTLRQLVSNEMKQAAIFRQMLASDFVNGFSPVTFFRDNAVEVDGSSSPGIDIQAKLVEPFVNFARLMAFNYGITETNTLARLRRLSDSGIFSSATIQDVSTAYEFNVQMLIMNQLKQIEAGVPLNNFVAVCDLSNIERSMLKETFSIMNRAVDVVRRRLID